MRLRPLFAIGAGLAMVGSMHPGFADAAGAWTRTTTTITASASSSTYDSLVTFTAQVGGTVAPVGGSVTFTDESNGSILDTASLVSGEAVFSTAALAPGSRRIVARYSGTGNGMFGGSVSSAVDVSVAAAGADAVTYQIDSHHDGNQAEDVLQSQSLHLLWNVTLGGSSSYQVDAGDVSYPVIAGGRVFVMVENVQSGGDVLDALDAGTGAVDWSVPLAGTYGFAALAYDGQTLFAINSNGELTAIVASSGQELWAEAMPGQYSFSAPPTAYDGVVYVSGAGSGGTLYAVSEGDGVVRWTGSVENGDKSSPAVDNSGVYVSYACQQDYRFKLGGALVWHHTTGCEGGGGSTAVLHGTSLYARGSVPLDTPVLLSTQDGSSVATFASRVAPAFGGKNMYTLVNGNLIAVDPSGSPDRWTFSNGSLVTAPVVSGGVVYMGDSDGTVYGVSASSGKQVWSGVAGSTILAPDEQNADVLIGMAVGGGELVVPAGNQLSAFGD
jgi:outer membrane protein assembly factor BamB